MSADSSVRPLVSVILPSEFLASSFFLISCFHCQLGMSDLSSVRLCKALPTKPIEILKSAFIMMGALITPWLLSQNGCLVFLVWTQSRNRRDEARQARANLRGKAKKVKKLIKKERDKEIIFSLLLSTLLLVLSFLHSFLTASSLYFSHMFASSIPCWCLLCAPLVYSSLLFSCFLFSSLLLFSLLFSSFSLSLSLKQ